MKLQKTILSVAVAAAFPAHAETILTEDFESPDVSATSTLQYGGTFEMGALPDNGHWIGAAQGFGAGRFGMIDKVHGDYTAPSGNEQGIYFGYTNSGVTTPQSAIGRLGNLGEDGPLLRSLSGQGVRLSYAAGPALEKLAAGE
jgi:hypothetical protein